MTQTASTGFTPRRTPTVRRLAQGSRLINLIPIVPR